MGKVITQLPEIKLVGITARTSNAAEMNPEAARIPLTMQRFFGEGMQDRIFNKKNPGRIFAVYTDYESDKDGEYTYFLGEEVTSFDNIKEDFRMLTIPGQAYAKFTPNPGVMPKVVIDMWLEIWGMDAAELGGERTYLADFEVYDERSRDPNNAILDIYIGIQD